MTLNALPRPTVPLTLLGQLIAPIWYEYLKSIESFGADPSDLPSFSTYDAIRSATGANATQFGTVLERATGTNQGFGFFVVDPSDSTSADNDGTIIVDSAGRRWKRQYDGGVRVDWFDFLTGNAASANDAAVAKAAAVLGASFSGQLVFPGGTYPVGTLNFDNALGLRLSSDGGPRNGTVLLFSGTGLKIRSSFDCTIEDITFTATTGMAVQYFIDAQHKPATTVDTRQLLIRRCTFDGLGSASGGTYTVMGVSAYQVSSTYIENCTFLRLLRGIDGQTNNAPSSTNFSNNVSIIDCTFTAIMGFPLTNPGENWMVLGGYTQMLSTGFLSDGYGRVAYGDSNVVITNLQFVNHGVYDTVSGSNTNFIDIYACQGLTITGGHWGGQSGSNLLIARGAVIGLSIQTKATNFNTIAYANVAGQKNWSFQGSIITGTSSIVGNPGNVAVLNTDGVEPYASQGTFAATGSMTLPNGVIEKWGVETGVSPGGTRTVTFSSAFPNACWNVQLTLQDPATTTNKESLVGNPATNQFQYFINGSGNSSVRWRAIGN